MFLLSPRARELLGDCTRRGPVGVPRCRFFLSQPDLFSFSRVAFGSSPLLALLLGHFTPNGPPNGCLSFAAVSGFSVSRLTARESATRTGRLHVGCIRLRDGCERSPFV